MTTQVTALLVIQLSGTPTINPYEGVVIKMEVGHCVLLSYSTSYYVLQRVGFYRHLGLWMKFFNVELRYCIAIYFYNQEHEREGERQVSL